MRRRTISPESVFNSQPLGFSQGVLIDGSRRILFISGQLAARADGKFVGGSFRDQCRRAYKALDAVLREAKADRSNVTKITAYVTDMGASIDEFTRQTLQYFKGEYPASTLVEVRALAFPGQLVEIEAIAAI